MPRPTTSSMTLNGTPITKSFEARSTFVSAFSCNAPMLSRSNSIHVRSPSYGKKNCARSVSSILPITGNSVFSQNARSMESPAALWTCSKTPTSDGGTLKHARIISRFHLRCSTKSMSLCDGPIGTYFAPPVSAARRNALRTPPYIECQRSLNRDQSSFVTTWSAGYSMAAAGTPEFVKNALLYVSAA